jgi:acetyl-CoA C-acetyltransferase
MPSPRAFIVAAARTAAGKNNGTLSTLHPADLGAAVVNSLVGERTPDFDPSLVDDVIFGCVSQVGEQSCNVARNVVLSSVLPMSVPGTAVDRQCGSSQQAIHFAAQAVMSGTQNS